MGLLLSVNTTDPDLVKSIMFYNGVAEVAHSVIKEGPNRDKTADDARFKKAYDASARSTERYSIDFPDETVRVILKGDDELSDEEEAKVKLHLTIIGNKTEKSFRFVGTDAEGKIHCDLSVTHADFRAHLDYQPHPLVKALNMDQPATLALLAEKGLYIDAEPPVLEKINGWIFAAMIVSVFTSGAPGLDSAFPKPESQPRVN